MSQNGSNIISFDGSRRVSARASRDAAASYAVRSNEAADQRESRMYARSSRVSSHAVGETVSSSRGLNYSQSFASAGDSFARREKSRFSKVTRSGRIEPIGDTRDDDGEARFAANARVSTRPARASRNASAQAAERPSSGFDLGAFSAFDDLDEQLFGSGSGSARSSSRRSSRGSASSRLKSRSSEQARSSAQPRAAVEMFDPNDVEDDETGANAAGSRRSKRERREKSKAKAKAEKMFNRQFGGDAAPSAETGSRAAVYKGEMGRNHKRAFADLGGFDEKDESAKRATHRGQQAKAKHGAPILAYVIGAAVCVAVAALFLFPTAQQFYIESRTQDRLQAEYDQLAQRNAAIQSDIDRLSTDEGIQDAAREQLGWVAAGETAGVVVGLDGEDESGTSDAVYERVDSDSVKTPDTWYSAWLDPLFGYTDGQ